jgi:UDP-glucose 4-epimerase
VPRIAVLGATGFIGRHTVDELQRRGVEVVAVTRGTDVPPSLRASASITCQLVAGYDTFDGRGIDAVIHLASGSVAAAATSTAHEEALRIAGHLVTQPIRRIVFASSATVYGDKNPHPRLEFDPLDASSQYARTKAATEMILQADARTYIARLANVYGGGMSPQNIFSEILAQATTDGPIRVRDVAPVRDYVAVRDVARGLVDMALAEGAAAGIYNLATGRGTSVRSLAELLCQILGQNQREILATAPSDRSSTLVLSPEKAARTLGWTPTVLLSEGVRELVKGPQ